MARLELVVPVALLITLVLLFNAFGTFGPAVLVLLNVPFALVGGVAGLALDGHAAVGRRRRSASSRSSARRRSTACWCCPRSSSSAAAATAARRGHRRAAAASACAPVLMTAALAALGLVPAAMSHAIGSEMQRPIAVVIVGGTLSACALTLVVLPVMYRLWSKDSSSSRSGASCRGAPCAYCARRGAGRDSSEAARRQSPDCSTVRPTSWPNATSSVLPSGSRMRPK